MSRQASEQFRRPIVPQDYISLDEALNLLVDVRPRDIHSEIQQFLLSWCDTTAERVEMIRQRIKILIDSCEETIQTNAAHLSEIDLSRLEHKFHLLHGHWLEFEEIAAIIYEYIVKTADAGHDLDDDEKHLRYYEEYYSYWLLGICDFIVP